MISRIQDVLRHITRQQWKMLVMLGLALFCLSVFTAIAEDVINKEAIVQVDLIVADMLHNAATPLTTTFFSAITLLGYEGLRLVSAIVVVYFLLRRRWSLLIGWIVTVGLGELLNLLLKSAFVRPRPVFIQPILIEHGYSFPSGHAMGSLIAYGLLSYLICSAIRRWPMRLLVVLAAISLILLVGFSRMVLGVHYLSDVIGGFATGGLWLVVSITCWNIIRSYRAHRRALQDSADGVPPILMTLPELE